MRSEFRVISGNQRLLRTASPKDDESLMGYIIRLTEHNGYESPGWIIKLAGLNYANLETSCALLFKSPDSLKLLATVTDNIITDWSLLTYPPAKNYLHNYYLFCGIAIHRKLIRPNYAKLCPKCLSETAYCRRIWDLIFITVCPAHGCLLIDVCPNCNQRINWARNHVTMCNCKFDWRDSSILPVREQEIELARHVYRAYGLTSDENTFCLAQKNPALTLNLQDFIQLLIFVAGQYLGISSATGYHIERINNNKELHALFTKAYCVLEDWPNHFYEFLDWTIDQERSVDPIKQRLKSALYRDFGKFYIGLYNKLTAGQFEFIKKSFIEYLNDMWDGGYISTLDSKKGIAPQPKSKYISRIDARRLLEADDDQIYQLIGMGKVKTMVQSKGKKRLIFIDLADVSKLRYG